MNHIKLYEEFQEFHKSIAKKVSKLMNKDEEYTIKDVQTKIGQSNIGLLHSKEAAKVADALRNMGYKVNEAEMTVQIAEMNPLQFCKLIDLLEADIEMYDADDMEYYEQMTGLDTGTLLDLYAEFGFKKSRYDGYVETQKLIKAYEKATGKSFKRIKAEAEKME